MAEADASRLAEAEALGESEEFGEEFAARGVEELVRDVADEAALHRGLPVPHRVERRDGLHPVVELRQREVGPTCARALVQPVLNETSSS